MSRGAQLPLPLAILPEQSAMSENVASPPQAHPTATPVERPDPSNTMTSTDDLGMLDPDDLDDSFMLEPKRRSPTRSAFLRFRHVPAQSLVHFVPIAITLGVLSLTFMQVFWRTPSSEINTVLNVLQFAAQFHGSLIVMSLSSIVLHMVSTGLRSSRGISHGLLTSSFQLNSLSYLFRSEFWAGMADQTYVAIFLSIFLLAFTCQPSSAIAMLPRLQYWPGVEIYPGNTIQYHAYIQGTERTIYPNILTADNAPSNCSRANASLLENCPSSGIANILLQDSLFKIPYSSVAPQINLTIDSGWRRQILGSEPPVYRGIYSSYNARTLSNFLGTALTKWAVILYQFGMPYTTNKVNIQRAVGNGDLQLRYGWSLRSGTKKVPTKRPTVHVECAGYAPDVSEIIFPEGGAGPEAGSLKVPSSQFQDLSIDTTSDSVNFTFVDVQQFADSRPSLLALFGTPAIHSGATLPSGDIILDNGSYSLFGCKFDAHWEQASVFYDDTVGSASVFDVDPESGAEGTDDWIQIHAGFADYLNVPYFEGAAIPSETNRSTLQVIGEKCIAENTYMNSTLHVGNIMSLQQCFQVSLSAFVVDALSRVQDSVPAYFVASGRANDGYDYEGDLYYVQSLYDTETVGYSTGYEGLTQDDFNDPTRFTEILIPLSRYGYGYGWADSKLIYVATVVLLIHVAVCVIHIIWVAVKDPQDEMGWQSLGDLIAVLLRSPNAEKGVPLLKTNRNWKDRVTVRLMEDDEKVSGDGRLSAADARIVADKPNTLVLRRIPARPTTR